LPALPAWQAAPLSGIWINHTEKVVIWGTGSPRREFLHVDDMADACGHVMTLSDSDIETHLTHYPSPCFVNIGTGNDCTILDWQAKISLEDGIRETYDWFVNKR